MRYKIAKQIENAIKNHDFNALKTIHCQEIEKWQFISPIPPFSACSEHYQTWYRVHMFFIVEHRLQQYWVEGIASLFSHSPQPEYLNSVHAVVARSIFMLPNQQFLQAEDLLHGVGFGLIDFLKARKRESNRKDDCVDNAFSDTISLLLKCSPEEEKILWLLQGIPLPKIAKIGIIQYALEQKHETLLQYLLRTEKQNFDKTIQAILRHQTSFQKRYFQGIQLFTILKETEALQNIGYTDNAPPPRNRL